MAFEPIDKQGVDGQLNAEQEEKRKWDQAMSDAKNTLEDARRRDENQLRTDVHEIRKDIHEIRRLLEQFLSSISSE